MNSGTAQAASPTPRHRLLIVDDEEATRLLFAHILTRALQAEVQLAGTCEQALRFAGGFAYDAIVLDLMMPGVGGLEVLKEIRAASPNADTPIVVVTVLSDRPTIDACLGAGANAYLIKPVAHNLLIRTVQAQIQARRRPAHAAADAANA